MHYSLLCASTLALLSIAGRLLAADTTRISSEPRHVAQIQNPAPAITGSVWWNSLGSDSLPYDSLQRIPVNIGIMSASDANGREPRKVANSFSLTLVSSEIGAIRGVQFSGAMNDVHGSVRGLQGSAGLNLVGGNVVGYQGASVNLVKGDVSGLQYGALYNRVGGDLEGVQIGLFGNVVAGEVRGLQTASIVNRAESVKGVQDGFLNLVDRADGVQCGFVNIADRVDGVQCGFVNIADTMTGPQIGLVNIRPDARVFVEAWTDEVGLHHLGLNYGSPGWYNLVDIASRSTDSKRVALGMGFGGRLPSERLILSTDLSALMVFDPDKLKDNRHGDSLTTDEKDAINGLFRARATVGWHFWKYFAVFGGASWNVLAVPDDGHGTRQLRPYEGYHWDANEHVRMWPGLFAGIRI